MLGQSIASSTRATYSSGVKRYLDFCFAHRLASPDNLLPPQTEETLVYFVATLQGHVQYQTIKLYLAAVNNFYIDHNQHVTTNNMLQLRRILKGIKRSSGTKQRIRRPMTISILSQISALLRPSFSDDLDTVMLWAAFTLAFFGFLRVSEFTYYSPPAGKPFLAVNDANFIPNITNPTSILLTIKQSKTDPFRQGTTLTISKSHSPVCAVNTLREYLLQRNPTNLHEPLFTLKNGEPLTRTVVNSNLRELLKQLGYVDKDYAPHSFRIGAATTAAAANLPPWLIKTLGRWRSDCYELYIKTPRSIIDSVPEKLASVLSP